MVHCGLCFDFAVSGINRVPNPQYTLTTVLDMQEVARELTDDPIFVWWEKSKYLKLGQLIDKYKILSWIFVVNWMPLSKKNHVYPNKAKLLYVIGIGMTICLLTSIMTEM